MEPWAKVAKEIDRDLYGAALRGDWKTYEDLLKGLSLDDVEILSEVLHRAAQRATRAYFKRLAAVYDEED